MQDHISTEHKAPESCKQIRCEQCDIVITSAGELQAHMMEKHETAEILKEVKCEQCDFTTTL